MRHVVCEVAETKSAAKHECRRVAEAKHYRAEYHECDGHRSNKRHDIATGVTGIGVMAAMHEEAERRGARQHAIEMEDQPVERVLERTPGGQSSKHDAHVRCRREATPGDAQRERPE